MLQNSCLKIGNTTCVDKVKVGKRTNVAVRSLLFNRSNLFPELYNVGYGIVQ